MSDQPSTAPFTVPRADACPRCDGPRDLDEPYVCCPACIEAAHRAIAARDGQVVMPADIEAARLA